MSVRFVQSDSRFMFQAPVLTSGKVFKLKMKGLLGPGAEASVQSEGGNVTISPSKGILQINGRDVQVTTTLAHGDEVTLKKDDNKFISWQFQTDLAAAKRARQDKEKAGGTVREAPNLDGKEGYVKWLRNRAKFSEQGVQLKSLFGWKTLTWDQIGAVRFLRQQTGAAAGGGLVGAAIGAAIDSTVKGKGDSEYVNVFGSGFYTVSFLDHSGRGLGNLTSVQARTCVVIGDTLEYYAPIDLVQMGW